MLRSTLVAATLFASLAACNISSGVGANDTGGGGSASQSTASGEAGSGSGGSPDTTSTTGRGGATGTGGATSTSASTGSGGHIEGAYLSLQVQTGFDFLGSETVIEIQASATPIADMFAVGAPAACNGTQQPSTEAPPPNNLDLSAAHVTVTAEGQTPQDATWSADFEEFVLQFTPSLPPGTTVHVAFDAASPLLPNHGFDLVTPNVTVDAPAPSSVYEYPTGTDVAFTWSGDAIPYGLSSFVVMTNPPPPASTLVVRCVGDGSSSALTLDAGLMSQLVSDLDQKLQTDPTSQIYFGLSFEKVAAAQEPVDGNFVSRSGVVSGSWPVVPSN